MPVAMTDKTMASRGDSNPADASPPSERMSGEPEARPSLSRPPDHRPSWRRRVLIGACAALVLVTLGIIGIPFFVTSLNTVSTDDAYVNGHVTFVAPRVGGQISRV